MAYLLGRIMPLSKRARGAGSPYSPGLGGARGPCQRERRPGQRFPCDRADWGTVRETMAAVMELRLPLDTRLVAMLPVGGLAMLVCDRRIDGSWRIAVDAWRLSAVPAG
jgi:hypothetical protein